jgi:hypothetical protein
MYRRWIVTSKEHQGVTMSDGGKGSKPRPYSVSDIEYADRWDAIFHKDKKPELKEVIEHSNRKMLTSEDHLQMLVDENQRLGLYE